MELISQLSDSGLLVDCMNIYEYYSNQVLNEGLFLFDKYDETNYIYNAKQYYYDIEQEYCGLLPFLYENGGKDLCLFNDLFNLLLNSSIKIIDLDTLLDFCVFISDEKYILRVKEVINK